MLFLYRLCRNVLKAVRIVNFSCPESSGTQRLRHMASFSPFIDSRIQSPVSAESSNPSEAYSLLLPFFIILFMIFFCLKKQWYSLEERKGVCVFEGGGGSGRL